MYRPCKLHYLIQHLLELSNAKSQSLPGSLRSPKHYCITILSNLTIATNFSKKRPRICTQLPIIQQIIQFQNFGLKITLAKIKRKAISQNFKKINGFASLAQILFSHPIIVAKLPGFSQAPGFTLLKPCISKW